MSNTQRLIREIALIALLALVVFAPAFLFAQEPGRESALNGADLIAAIQHTPGCLGVEAARTAGGKQVIFAWFENKQAVLNWVNSDAHQALIRTFTPSATSGRMPLDGIAADQGPILTIASLTYANTPQVAGVGLPVSQIAIELYAPLPGGLAVGGRFAPDTVKVPGLLQSGSPVNR